MSPDIAKYAQVCPGKQNRPWRATRPIDLALRKHPSVDLSDRACSGTSLCPLIESSVYLHCPLVLVRARFALNKEPII